MISPKYVASDYCADYNDAKEVAVGDDIFNPNVNTTENDSTVI
jgi:hypothetical protein